ncbi:hypothetical protein KU73_22230 [Pectobacterium wasabiae]|uniref:Uncharacterized protein n=2 Tax=Pectobacterium TaxID=122277 RepID=A0AAW3EC39_9GAMM|nr:hypothetical protein [Pectobacterium betavasculorum]AOR66027.1 hypothetical protein A7983_22710 [Pectobacterium wasabiae CFBP 3304]KFX01350.1 hypothetical protein JV38_22390 [Pectobacterium wasabiae]EJS96578.1 Hypothetical protein Y17_0099 [Pectobacterium wasabiae CFBP 3304]KFX21186.1 hypothetical protein JV35_08355 [Pectobacterium betavasculorum]KGA26257.1 hypothetical protein KU73_22230 [Pectobacterium wasabiae]
MNLKLTGKAALVTRVQTRINFSIYEKPVANFECWISLIWYLFFFFFPTARHGPEKPSEVLIIQ